MSNDVITVGDRFLVEVEVTRNGACDPYVIARPTVGNDGDKFVIGRNILLAAKRLPRPLKVGDRVRRHYGPCASAFGVILALHANKAWIDLGDQTTVWLLSDLTPAEESAS
jgi:hypothetical protein